MYLQNIRNKIAIITHIEDHFAKTEFKLKNQRLSRACIAHLRHQKHSFLVQFQG